MLANNEARVDQILAFAQAAPNVAAWVAVDDEVLLLLYYYYYYFFY